MSLISDYGSVPTGSKVAHARSLAKAPTQLARFRSRALRALVTFAVPRQALVTRGPGRKRQVALTFDDGPDAMTMQYLDVLDGLGVRATFFVIGAHAAKNPDRVLEYARRGHEVCNHGYSHRPLPGMGPAQLVDELARTGDLLPPSISPRPFVRPPRGLVSARSVARVFAAGYTTALWSLDSDDCRTRDPRVVEDRVRPENVKPGEIVLLHEFQSWTLTALPKIVGRLRDAGYTFPTLGEMLGY